MMMNVAIVDSAWLKPLVDVITKGGWFMLPLVITLLVATTAAIYKVMALAKKRVLPKDLVDLMDRYIIEPEAKLEQEMLGRIYQNDCSLARLAAVVVKHRTRSRMEIAHAVESASRSEVAYLYAGIGVLDIVVTIAPLLGLLGTAAGVVKIFEGVSGHSDQTIIAGGIAEALYTTIFGLVIAVPCVVVHTYFTRKIEVYTAEIESLLSDLSHSFEVGMEKEGK